MVARVSASGIDRGLLQDSSPADRAHYEHDVASLFEEGDVFLAQDLAERGLTHYPDSVRLKIIRALAFARTGAVDEARDMLLPILEGVLIDERPYRQAHNAIKRVWKLALDEADSTDRRELHSSISTLAEALEDVRGKKHLGQEVDAETLELLGQTHLEAWKSSHSQDDLKRARDLFLTAFRTGRRPKAGGNAALMSLLLDQKDFALRLARDVLLICSEQQEHYTNPFEDQNDGEKATAFWRSATTGIACLMLGKERLAVLAYRQAAELAGRRYSQIVMARQQLDELSSAGITVPESVWEIMQPPRVVVFTGPMLDNPGVQENGFPPHIENALRAEIDERLDHLTPQIGYCSASAGADLLFIEAMLERAAEVNIILPYDQEDFIRHNVRFAGSRWEMRFRNALKLANSVSYATTERFLGHDNLMRFMNQMLQGISTLRARFLDTAPYLLAVWDQEEGHLTGGAAEFIDQWADIARLQIIDPEMVDPGVPGGVPGGPDQQTLVTTDTIAAPLAEDMSLLTTSSGRVIKCMLFADIKGFSGLGEEHIPSYIAFLQRLRAELSQDQSPPDLVNTWGDALFVVMDRATDLARYALKLKEAVRKVGSRKAGLPRDLSIRISLHAGPVFETADAFTGKPNFYGSHINRAARLEPVTVPGQVYATQQFVALLTAEEGALRYDIEADGGVYHAPHVCQYVGVLALAKNFGSQPVYHIREATKDYKNS